MKYLYYDGEEIYTSEDKSKIEPYLKGWKDYFLGEKGLFETYCKLIGKKFKGKFNPKRLTGKNSSWDRDKYSGYLTDESNYLIFDSGLAQTNKATEIRNCDWCGSKYTAKRSQLSRGWGLCCSKSCSAKKRIANRSK